MKTHHKNSEAGRIVQKMQQVLGDMTGLDVTYSKLSSEQRSELQYEMASRIDYFGDFNGFVVKIMRGELHSRNEVINKIIRETK